jgi:hypothetical protein
MTIPLHQLDQRFIDAAYNAPYAEIFQRDEVQQAGAQLQRLAQRLAPFLEGGLTIAEEGVQQLVKSYAEDYSLSTTKNQASLTAWGVQQLLKHAPNVTPESLRVLADELGTLAEAVETAQQHGPQHRSETANSTSGRSWASRQEERSAVPATRP